MSTRIFETALTEQMAKFEQSRRAASMALVDLVCEQLIGACEFAGVKPSEFDGVAGGKNIFQLIGEKNANKMYSLLRELHVDATVFTRDLATAMGHRGLNSRSTLSVLYDDTVVPDIRFRKSP